MKPTLSVLIVATVVLAGPAMAQGTPAALTRAQVKMERLEFLKSHQWDEEMDVWVLKPGYDAPAGVMSRSEVMAARNEFLRNNRWNEAQGGWTPIKSQPRDLGTLDREQMRAETRRFVRSHRWDEQTETWVARIPRSAKP